MKYWLLSLLLIATFCTANAQKQDNVWVFGNAAGLDFNSGSPVSIHTSISTVEGSASVCDTNGQLLFYTEGSTVWSRNGNAMPNGSDISGLGNTQYGYSPTASTTQSSLIVPVPKSNTLFYLFSLTDGTLLGKHYLYYSVIDMSLNGGQGDVVAGRKGILIDSALSEKLTGVVGKCCNLWVVVNKADGNFHAFEITDAGLNTTPVISPSGINSGLTYNYGEIKFNSRGDKMAAGNQIFFGLRLYDFDGYTGIFSNIRNIAHRDVYGICFSPDDTKLYAASVDTLFQYDVTQPTTAGISGSEQKIGTTDNLTIIKKAPNNKLYFWKPSGIAVINQPNLAGTACNVVANAVTLLAGTGPVIGGLSNDVFVLKHDTAAFVRTHVTQCFTDSILLHANAAGCRYKWPDGSGNTSYMVYHNDDYVVQYYTPACTYHADTFDVHFASPPPLAGAYSGCEQAGTSYLYVHPGVGDNSLYTYTWHDSAGHQLQQHTSTAGDTLYASVTGKYSVHMGSDGCDTTILLSLSPSATVSVSFTTDTTICLGEASIFTNSSQGLDNYLWIFGDGSTSILASPQHTYAHPGRYHVLLVGYPCGDTAGVTVIVDTGSYLSFTTDKADYCKGENIVFNMSYPAGATDISWDFGDGGALLHELNPYHAYEQPGTYTIHAMARFRACRDTSFSYTLSVYDYPVVNLGPDTSMCPGQGFTLQLMNLAAQDPATNYSYLWSTGAISSGITTDTSGAYWLALTTDKGCKTIDTMIINPNCYISIPNAFTPNGDGVNDYFFPRQFLSEGLISFKMEIYSRWGELIFSTTNTDGRGWDGRFNGVIQPEGVFIYMVEATFKNGRTEHHAGNVTLLR